MATWSLHIVGQELEDEVKEIGAELVKVLEGHGHQLVSAVLGTDKGTEDVPLTEPEPEVTPLDEPAVTPPEDETPLVPVDTPPEPPASA